MKQISVFLENKTGSLREMTEVLAKNNVNLAALSLAEAEGFGIVRLIAKNLYEATTVLKDAGFIHNIVDVVSVTVPDEAGGLAKILKVLDDEGINLEYMYAYSNGKAAAFALKVADVQKTEAALRAQGIRIIEK